MTKLCSLKKHLNLTGNRTQGIKMTHENEQELERVQVHISLVKEAIEVADKLIVLNNIPEFEELIIKGFMENEPARLASIITDPNLLSDEDQREILGAIKAVGYLGDYLRNIEKRGAQMKQALTQSEQYQTDLLNVADGEE